MSWLVTGAGAVASVGTGVDPLFEALCAGHSGLSGLRGFDPERFRVRHAYEIDDRPAGADEPGRATRWLLDAVEEAVGVAGIDDLTDVPILVGTGLRELRSLELHWLAHDPGEPLPPTPDLHFGPALRERLGAGATYTFSNACSASLYALALATDLIELDRADTVIVAGTDTLTESMFGLLDRVHPEPPDSVRPFDRARRGVLMGDGAAAVVVRRDEPNAADALGRLRGVAIGCDAFHVTAPDPAGIAATIKDAHERAGVRAEDIDLVMVHGTGTLLNDEAEAAAIAEVFGPHAGRPLMTAIKSMTGHTSGGSGLIGLVVALSSLTSGRVPPTLGLVDPVPEASGFRFAVGGAAREELTLAQVDAFGFGGVNAVAVLERTRP